MHNRRRRGKDWVPDFGNAADLRGRFSRPCSRPRSARADSWRSASPAPSSTWSPSCRDAAELRDLRMQLPLTVYSRDGRLIAQIGEQRRIPVAAAEIPQVVVDAFLAAEDDRFFQHPGVDWQGLVRALASNVSAGGVREGGGTITMQLARNTLLTPERTLRRKLKEVFLALRIEREFGKDEILAQYLNRIFLGQRAYGVGAAAEVYFNKRVADLTLPEAALIAGLPRSPSRDNPAASRRAGARAPRLRAQAHGRDRQDRRGRARSRRSRADIAGASTRRSCSSRPRTSPRWRGRRWSGATARPR